MDLSATSVLPLLTAANVGLLAGVSASVPLVRHVYHVQQISRRGEPIKTLLGDSVVERLGEVQAVRFSRMERVPEPAPYNEVRSIYYECRYLIVRLLGVPVHCEGDEVQIPDEIVAAILGGRRVSPASLNHLFDARLAVPPPRLQGPGRATAIRLKG